jgi:hypothetical protein
MRRSVFIILTLFLLPFYAAAYPLFFPFDSLNTPDETLPDAPGGFYVAGAFYFLNDTGEYYDDAGKTRDCPEQDWWYIFVPLNVGYRFGLGFEGSVQATIVKNDTSRGSYAGVGDVWLKVKYTKRLNDRYYLGGRVAGKFLNTGRGDYPAFLTDLNDALDLVFLGGVIFASPIIAEFTIGYRTVWESDVPSASSDNLFHLTVSPGASFMNERLHLYAPISYFKSLGGYFTIPEDPRDPRPTGLSAGFKATYAFENFIRSTITVRGDFPLHGRNVPRDYFIGGAYSAVVPF